MAVSKETKILYFFQIGGAKLLGKFCVFSAKQILADYQVKFTNEHNITLQLICTTKILCIHSVAWYCRIQSTERRGEPDHLPVNIEAKVRPKVMSIDGGVICAYIVKNFK